MTALAPNPSALPENLASRPVDRSNAMPRRTHHPSTTSSGYAEMTPERPSVVKRRNLGDWNLEKTIGAGSMGKVKLARHHITGEQVCSTNESLTLINVETRLRSR